MVWITKPLTTISPVTNYHAKEICVLSQGGQL